ncbi:MAG: leucine--tRNA ligase [Thermaerobacter sp.]|nr:leucine--tRNA ligase [Thermaerobacter sp.]
MQIERDVTRPSTQTDRYDVKAVEEFWQRRWEEEEVYRAEITDKPKFYCLEQFPYPSGHLHMGHVRVYTLGDVIARYRRMRGYSVLHPMGWDAFGMPAENAAIKSGIPPRSSTIANIAYMKGQMRQMGLSFDWNREVATCEPDYYRFTQELFLLFYERGLAYQKAGAVNWCPHCETVLANEQVEEGRCWRCDAEVTKRDLTQWYFRITDYADRLLEGLRDLDWPPEIKTQQDNWIGRSEGAEVAFPVPDLDETIRVFTTRPDTLYGATYVVLAPEHPFVERLIAGRESAEAVRAFAAGERVRSDMERTAENTEKSGIFTGAYATHPLTGQPLPIWVANYVLVDYGTGAVMGVPAHDQRDFVFARKYHLPVRVVVSPDGQPIPNLAEPYLAPGRLVDSGSFSGIESQAAIGAIAAHLQEKGLGRLQVSYRMRDWLISRQRYWGAPIPIIHCRDCGAVPVPRADLPVLLPENVTFTGQGGSPLAAAEEWVATSCPRCKNPARRETDTMDTFVDSSWYYFRYTSPQEPRAPFDPEKANRWMAVDEYVGGKEHAVLHLLYSRFFTKVLHDAGWIAVDEPFRRLLVQGMVVYGGAKMSKSKGNTLSPESIMARWGADATRLFMLFAAPPEKDFEWSDQGVEGSFRFLQRVYRLAVRTPGSGDDAAAGERIERARARAVRKLTEDLGDRRAFNTAVSALMEYTNALYQDADRVPASLARRAIETLVLLLAPLAPHLSQELWQRMGSGGSVHAQAWPAFDDKWLTETEVEIVLQVNGKIRARITVPADVDEERMKQQALADERIQVLIADKIIRKVVAIPGRLVNVVVA